MIIIPIIVVNNHDDGTNTSNHPTNIIPADIA